MDDVYKIALSAFMHDIGKFAERAGFDLSDEYLNNNASLYQPYIKEQNRFSHRHAVYTAGFIEYLEEYLPSKFNRGNWGLEESFVNLAASHHKPETALQWIIAIADRVSSGFDRNEFEIYNKGVAIKDYKKTRLLTVFEQIYFDEKQKSGLDSYNYRYPLKELSPHNIFPEHKDKSIPNDDKKAQEEYNELFMNFIEGIEKLEHKINIPLWFEHFENLFMIYASHIPAATVGKIIPDVSLFDHSKMTSAIAVALYKYHKENNDFEIEDIKNYDVQKFILINGGFFGIQKYIFSGESGTNKFSAKILRGRSFSISLITELAAELLCREIGLPSNSILLNASGKFTILAPNIPSVIEKINNIEKEINNWFIRKYYGEVSLGLSSIEASCEDFVLRNFHKLYAKLSSIMDDKKYYKINLEEYGGVVKDYLDNFINELPKPLCQFCEKRPSSKDVNDENIRKAGLSACKICVDHIYIGENLVKADRLAITHKDADLHGKKLFEPIFDRFQISFDVSGKLSEISNEAELYKYWDISISEEGKISKEITSKFINGYVPVYEESDNNDDRILHGERTEKSTLELINMIKLDSPKSFHHIAKMSLLENDKKNYRGTEAIGVIKADVDNLGSIFSYGIKQDMQSISRISTLSRQMNNYFAVYIPYLLKTTEEYKNIYTLFSGGDDLFLIGPWNKTIDFSKELKKSFSEYVCGNKKITISAGLTIHKPHEPVNLLAEKSERALESAKINGRDSITVFNETVKWDEFEKLLEIYDILEKWFSEDIFSRGLLYKLDNFSNMAKQEKNMLKTKYPLSMEIAAPYMLWRSNLKYNLARNVAKKLKGDERDKIVNKVIENSVRWLEEYSGKLKIPLWQIFYNYR